MSSDGKESARSIKTTLLTEALPSVSRKYFPLREAAPPLARQKDSKLGAKPTLKEQLDWRSQCPDNRKRKPIK